jgi:hypothetical protein
MHPRTKHARLVAAAAAVAVAIAVGDAAIGHAPRSANGLERLAFALDPCPFDAALITPLRSESGFECPINRTPAAANRRARMISGSPANTLARLYRHDSQPVLAAPIARVA